MIICQWLREDERNLCLSFALPPLASECCPITLVNWHHLSGAVIAISQFIDEKFSECHLSILLRAIANQWEMKSSEFNLFSSMLYVCLGVSLLCALSVAQQPSTSEFDHRDCPASLNAVQQCPTAYSKWMYSNLPVCGIHSTNKDKGCHLGGCFGIDADTCNRTISVSKEPVWEFLCDLERWVISSQSRQRKINIM